MSAGRVALAALACVLIAGSAASCTAVLGLNDLTNAAESMCQKCSGNLFFLGEKESCFAYFEKHLGAMSDEERAAWLEQYTHACTKCENATECFYWPKVCIDVGFACTTTEQCCSSLAGGKCNAGQCE